MLGSGFLTAAIGEPPVPAGCPARPAGLGDPEVVRPGDSCSTVTSTRMWGQKYIFLFKQKQNMIKKKKQKRWGVLTVAPLVGVAGCFASKDCGEKRSLMCPCFRLGPVVPDSFYFFNLICKVKISAAQDRQPIGKFKRAERKIDEQHDSSYSSSCPCEINGTSIVSINSDYYRSEEKSKKGSRLWTK